MATLITQGDNYGTHRRCDATCHNAKKPKCVCICGGRYHGKGSNSPALKEEVRKVSEAFLGAHPEIQEQLKHYKQLTFFADRPV